MTTIKRIAIFYCVNLFIYIIINVLFGGHLSDIVDSLAVWILPLFILFVGQTIGFFSFVLIDKNEQKARIFYKSALITSICYATILIGSKLINWNHHRKFGNIESNEDYFKYFIENNKEEKRIAFDTLIKKFKDRNAIRITGSASDGIDTIINGSPDTMYHLQFFYKKNNQTENYKSDFTIFKRIAHLNFYDRLLDANDEYKRDTLTKKAIQNVQDAIKDAPDSIKKIVTDNFKDFLER